MGVITIKKIWIALVFFLLLSSILASAVGEDTAALRDLNERLERNKAEILKAMTDNQAKSEAAIKKAVDDNFAVLDERIQGFLKDSTRSIAVIMVAGFMVGFALSQILRLKIEQSRRKAMVKMEFELTEKVGGLQQEALKLTRVVQELQKMNQKYSGQLEQLKPQPVKYVRTILFVVLGLIIVVAIIFFLVK